MKNVSLCLVTWQSLSYPLPDKTTPVGIAYDGEDAHRAKYPSIIILPFTSGSQYREWAREKEKWAELNSIPLKM